MRNPNDLTRPIAPPGAIQQRMLVETEEYRGVIGPAPALPGDAGAPTVLHAALGQAVVELAPQIVEFSHNIHDHPETGYEEHHAVATVAELLRRHGIEPEVGIYGMDTVPHAEIPGGGGVDVVAGSSYKLAGTIVILTGYDALPGIGHGCGHNVMCVNSVSAFLALAILTRTRPGSLPGRVALQTTPAEENSTAKKTPAVRGMLDGVDTATQTCSYAHDVIHQTWLGVRRLRVTFYGVPAHTVSQPFMGRNVLDAATPVLTGVSLLRQQVFSMDRLHAIITGDGQVPNITPGHTELSIMVCSKYLETLKEITEWVEGVLHGATLMTGTDVETLTSEYCNEVPVRDNDPLLTSWVRSQRERGRDPLAARVPPETIAAGTDSGNMSQHIPGIHPLIKVIDRPDVILHTLVTTEAAGAPTGDVAALDGAYGLAVIALNQLHDAGLRRAAHADFEAIGGAIDAADFWEE